MFDITKLALKIPNFLTHEECDGLINEFEERKDEAGVEYSGNANTGEVKYSNFKVVEILPKTNNFNFIKLKTQEAIGKYIEYLSTPNYFFTKALKENLQYSHKYRIMKYEKGASIHPHSDHEQSTYGSISFNLNNNYEGGEFKFFNGNHTISLGKGDALIFPADFFWVHEVTPVTKGSRYSINSFIKSSPSEAQRNARYVGDLIIKDYLQNTPPEELLGPYN